MSTCFINNNTLKVTVDDDSVKVYMNKTDLEPIVTFNDFKKTFVDDYVLIHRNNYDYIFISDKIFFFKALDEINRFVSDFYCPYAIDKSNNYYLLNDDLIRDQNNDLSYLNSYTIF